MSKQADRIKYLEETLAKVRNHRQFCEFKAKAVVGHGYRNELKERAERAERVEMILTEWLADYKNANLKE